MGLGEGLVRRMLGIMGGAIIGLFRAFVRWYGPGVDARRKKQGIAG
jgi:hypothetical protein